MKEIKNSILDELRRIAETYRSDYEIAKERQAGIEQELARAVSQSKVTDRAQVQLSELESNAQSYRMLYQDFLQRYTESVQAQSFPMTEARVVTPASRPLGKSSPKTFLVLLISSAGGLIFGVLIAHLRDLTDRVFRTREQVEQLLALSCLATVPRIKIDKKKARVSRSLSERRKAVGPKVESDKRETALSLKVEEDKPENERVLIGETDKPKRHTSPFPEQVGDESDATLIARRDDPLWQVVDFPVSPYAEAIRSIKLAVDLAGAKVARKSKKPKKVVGFTSCSPAEGKSTIAASLAQLISNSGKRVILVDCDLRAPRLTRVLAPGAKAGLLEVLSGEVSLPDVIWTDKSTDLNFLPAVGTARIPHTVEILGAEEMRALIDALRGQFDYVIVDLTPLLPIVDVRATQGLVDHYVFVVEWGHTKTELVQRALKEADGIYNKILGVVLNKVDGAELRRYEGYGNYHDKYYYRAEGFAKIESGHFGATR